MYFSNLLSRAEVQLGLITQSSSGSIPEHDFKSLMLYHFSNFQLVVDSYISTLQTTFYCIYLFVKTNIVYIQVDFLQEFKHLKWASRLLYRWVEPLRLYNLYNYTIADKSVFFWLWSNGTPIEVFTWNFYNLFFQLESNLYYTIATSYLVKNTLLSLSLTSYYVILLFKLVKFSLFTVFFINFFFYTRSYLRNFTWLHNIIYSKFFMFFETEEELGSLDDAIFFIMFFLTILVWYFLTTLSFLNWSFTSMSFLLIGFLLLLFFVLLIPFSVLLDFGVAFTTYIRGAGSGTNILVEVIFDLIGVLVVFTRFVVQNIRFVLIFAAYFELFEWVYNSPFILLFNSIFSVNTTLSSVSLTFTSVFYTISMIVTGLVFYAYYFIHLLILLFIQLGAYFLISFWLFFFFYTSFVLTKTERLFFFKRYI